MFALSELPDRYGPACIAGDAFDSVSRSNGADPVPRFDRVSGLSDREGSAV